MCVCVCVCVCIEVYVCVCVFALNSFYLSAEMRRVISVGTPVGTVCVVAESLLLWNQTNVKNKNRRGISSSVP